MNTISTARDTRACSIRVEGWHNRRRDRGVLLCQNAWHSQVFRGRCDPATAPRVSSSIQAMPNMQSPANCEGGRARAKPLLGIFASN